MRCKIIDTNSIDSIVVLDDFSTITVSAINSVKVQKIGEKNNIKPIQSTPNNDKLPNFF